MPTGQVWKRVWRSNLKTGAENYIFWSELGSGFGELGSTLLPLSPPQRLLLGIPIKIAIFEKLESVGDDCSPRTLSFFLPSLPTTQRGLCGGESSLQEFPGVPHQAFDPTTFKVQKKNSRTFQGLAQKSKYFFQRNSRTFQDCVNLV